MPWELWTAGFLNPLKFLLDFTLAYMLRVGEMGDVDRDVAQQSR